jgi:hypothetical protein
MITAMKTTVNKNDQFFIVVRRGSALQRLLNIWQRETKKMSPENTLRVHFAGENGIDTGAIAKEVLTAAISKIGKNMFPDGCPVGSMLNVHNGTFLTAGQVVAVSIVQGGPPPCFLEECIYEMLVNQDVDMNALNAEKQITQKATMIQYWTTDIQVSSMSIM